MPLSQGDRGTQQAGQFLLQLRRDLFRGTLGHHSLDPFGEKTVVLAHQLCRTAPSELTKIYLVVVQTDYLA